MIRLLVGIALWGGLCLTTGCGSGPIIAETVDLKGEQWAHDEPVVFQLEIEDTVAPHLLFIDLRNTKSYAYSNIFLLVDLAMGNQMILRDTVEIMLADASGKWTGSSSGALVDNHVLTYEDMVFTKPGTYTLKISQAMREDVLKHIVSVGISLFPSEN